MLRAVCVGCPHTPRAPDDSGCLPKLERRRRDPAGRPTSSQCGDAAGGVLRRPSVARADAIQSTYVVPGLANWKFTKVKAQTRTGTKSVTSIKSSVSYE